MKHAKRKSKYLSGVLLVGFLLLMAGIIFLFHSRPNPIAPGLSDLQTISSGGKVLSGSFDQTKLKTDAEWKKILTPAQYYILRQAGTEVPFTGSLLHNTQKGTYVSAGCNEPIFRSETKYDSGTGWPSFWQPISPDAVVLREDTSLGDTRVEVLDKCGGHLGHVFDDGPEPTGKRYCMNSDALLFIPDKQ